MSVVALPLDSTMILGGLMIFGFGLIVGSLIGYIIGNK